MKKKAIAILSFLLMIDFIFLTFLGKSYTKHIIIPPFLYAHDLVLLLLTIGGIGFVNNQNRIKSLEVLFIISIIYLLYSFFRIDFDLNNSSVVLRQFMIFAYGICIYIIINSLYSEPFFKKSSIKALIWFSMLTVLIQMVYTMYLFRSVSSNVFFNRNYFTPIVILGLFIAASYVLTHIKNAYLKALSFIAIFVLSFTTGHDSVYLSLAVIFGFYFFFRATKKVKIISFISVVLIAISAYIYIPSFSDVNMQWRLLYWGDVINRTVSNYGVLGDGFGIPYVSDQTIEKLNFLMSSNGHNIQIIGDQKYVSAPHNSFLTMMIHLGFIPILLLFYPFINLCQNTTWLKDKNLMFLCLSLMGMFMFSAFNVVLELPHSSSLIWVVYFIFIFKLKEQREQQSSI